MSKGLEALERIIGCSTIESHTKKWQQDYLVVEKELKALELIKKCFYVAKSSGAILRTDYGFEHEEELKEVLK